MATNSRHVWRLEFPQISGWRIPWLGPYTSQWLTAEAEELVRYMEAEHVQTRPHPADPTIFARYPDENRLATACATYELLERWFGHYLAPLRQQGAHLSQYAVRSDAIVEESAEQMLFIYRIGNVIDRSGHPPPAPLIRSSAGSRAAIIADSGGRYDYRPEPVDPSCEYTDRR
jgi:hypothetical protein